MDVFGLLAFLSSLLMLGIVVYIWYNLQKKKYNIEKIVERKVGNQLKQTLGASGNELSTAIRRTEKDVMAIFNNHVEELEEFLPGAKEYLDKGRPDLAVGGFLGFALKLLPLFINQSKNVPEGAKTALNVASQVASTGALEKIVSLIETWRNREKKPKGEKSEGKDSPDKITVPESFV